MLYGVFLFHRNCKTIQEWCYTEIILHYKPDNSRLTKTTHNLFFFFAGKLLRWSSVQYRGISFFFPLHAVPAQSAKKNIFKNNFFFSPVSYYRGRRYNTVAFLFFPAPRCTGPECKKIYLNSDIRLVVILFFKFDHATNESLL